MSGTPYSGARRRGSTAVQTVCRALHRHGGVAPPGKPNSGPQAHVVDTLFGLGGVLPVAPFARCQPTRCSHFSVYVTLLVPPTVALGESTWEARGV